MYADDLKSIIFEWAGANELKLNPKNSQIILIYRSWMQILLKQLCICKLCQKIYSILSPLDHVMFLVTPTHELLSILLLTWPLTGPAGLLMRACDMFVEGITILTEYSVSSLTGMTFVCKLLQFVSRWMPDIHLTLFPSSTLFHRLVQETTS
jgi:hypothetical protein